jgi:hypothetical protein
MKTKPIQGRCGRIVVLLVLTPMMTLNASQAMTLCVGDDGRVAIELLVQDHCACRAQTPGADSVLVGAASRIMDGRGQSCTDLAIPVGSCGIRVTPAASNAIPAGPTAAPPLPSPAALDAIQIVWLASPPAFTCYYCPLNSIILRL